MGSPTNVADEGRIALYVHVPFCETKCPYCDFNTYAGIDSLIPSYVPALCDEIAVWGRFLGRTVVGSVFFGGGTPSYLPARQIGSLMDAIERAFDLDADAEVTLEANPGDLAEAKLADYLSFHINRLSIGVQSFDDGLLGLLGRRHSARQAAQAYRSARQAGFDNVSIDVMYGLPHQTLEQWSRTLAGAAALMPNHVSMYCLTLEGGTPMERQVKAGLLPEPDPDLAADMYLMAEDAMGQRGYRHYEISNWARPGRESRHNMTYWKNRPYLGVGPGAHSYLAGHRFYNLKSPRQYVRRLEAGRRSQPPDRRLDAESLATIPAVEAVEPIDRLLEMAETMMMGLRLDTGIDAAEFASRFGETPDHAYTDALRDLENAGLLAVSDSSVALTTRGRLLGNEVFSRFFEYETPRRERSLQVNGGMSRTG